MKNKQPDKYIPEIGQAIFGQPYQRYEASELLLAALEAIRKELARVYWNNNQKKIQDPFGNTGGRYKNDVFEVEAYSWDEDKEQPYNFKWRDFCVSWYKYLGRETTCNRPISPDEINEMLEECLKSIRAEEKTIMKNQKIEKNIEEAVEELIKNTHITVKKGKTLPWDILVVKDILGLHNSLKEAFTTIIQQAKEEEIKRIEALPTYTFIFDGEPTVFKKVSDIKKGR